MLRLSWRAWLHHGAPRVGPWWIGHAWTLVFGLGVAAVLSVVTFALSSPATRAIWPTMVAANVIISVTISFAVRLAFWLARRAVGAGRLAAWSPSRRSIYFTLVPIAGVAVGWPLGMMLAGLLDERYMAPLVRPGMLASSVVIALVRHRPLPAVLPHQGPPDRRRERRQRSAAAPAAGADRAALPVQHAGQRGLARWRPTRCARNRCSRRSSSTCARRCRAAARGGTRSATRST